MTKAFQSSRVTEPAVPMDHDKPPFGDLEHFSSHTAMTTTNSSTDFEDIPNDSLFASLDPLAGTKLLKSKKKGKEKEKKKKHTNKEKKLKRNVSASESNARQGSTNDWFVTSDVWQTSNVASDAKITTSPPNSPSLDSPSSNDLAEGDVLHNVKFSSSEFNVSPSKSRSWHGNSVPQVQSKKSKHSKKRRSSTSMSESPLYLSTDNWCGFDELSKAKVNVSPPHASQSNNNNYHREDTDHEIQVVHPSEKKFTASASKLGIEAANAKLEGRSDDEHFEASVDWEFTSVTSDVIISHKALSRSMSGADSCDDTSCGFHVVPQRTSKHLIASGLKLASQDYVSATRTPNRKSWSTPASAKNADYEIPMRTESTHPSDSHQSDQKGRTESRSNDTEAFTDDISVVSHEAMLVVNAVEVHETDDEWPVIYAEPTKIGLKDFAKLRPLVSIVVIALILVVGGVVGIAVHLTRPKGVDAVTETSVPSMAPSSSPTLIADDIMLAAVELSETASLLDPSSPQFRAVGWMSTFDALDTVRFDSAFAQRYAMVVLYYSLLGEEWTNSEKWLDPGLHECDWSSGIICSDGTAETRVVTGFDATRNNLRGTIPAEIGLFAELQALRIPKNMVRGTIPLAIGRLTSLTSLDCSSNEIEGAIPTTIGQAQRLVYVDFTENRLNSTLPSEIFSLKGLESLVLASNNLTGSLAEELTDLQSLVTLNLGNNQLTGSLPLSLDSIASLDMLYLDRNQMTGRLPYLTAELAGFQVISLSHNYFSGNLELSPNFVATNVSLDDFRLQHIDISYNELSGPISSIFGFVPTMRYFDLSGNMFDGTFPSGVGWDGIKYLAAAENALTGSIPIGYSTLSK